MMRQTAGFGVSPTALIYTTPTGMMGWENYSEVAEQWNRRTLIIDLPGVKKLIEAAYRAGYQEVLDLVKPSFSLYRDIKDYEDNYVYEYMKALEAKDE